MANSRKLKRPETHRSGDFFTTTIRVPAETWEQFKAVAEANNRKPRQEIRYVIEQHVKAAA